MTSGQDIRVVEVAGEHAGWRLDRALAAAMGLSRARVQALIRAEQVSSGGRTIGDGSRAVKPGETYEVTVPEAAPAIPAAEAMSLQIVLEDAHLIVVDKPAGLVVHPAAGHESGTLVNALIAHCGESLSGIGGVKRPGIVHRLDKDTSGLLVVAKTDAAHAGLSEQFRLHGADGRLERRYLALVWGVPARKKGVIDAPLARSSASRTRIAVSRSETARRAVTHYEVLETFEGSDRRPLAALVELQLETGRTHQIRVHMAHIGHPVMGDPVYGAGFKTSAVRLDEAARVALERLDRQALHAAKLTIEHPVTGESLVMESALPKDISELLEALRGRNGRPDDKPKPRPRRRK
jgi:23S rRNA pseudouridine1911/1915/1917 synthase